MIERVSQNDFFAALRRRQAGPWTLSAELTWRCSFSCGHCYLGPLRSHPAHLDGDTWCRLLDGAAQLGCLGLVLTGGEPLLHPDFTHVYAHAVESGFLVTLFTNGFAVDAGVVDLLGSLPPHHVEVSLYGASDATYLRATGAAGAFTRVARAVDAMLERGIELRLKTVALDYLLDDVAAMRAFAASRGLDLTVDPVVDPAIDGDPAPLDHRVDPEQGVALEMASPARRHTVSALPRDGGGRLRCGAASAAFNLDPRGLLSPCLMVRNPSADAVRLGVAGAFARVAQTFADDDTLPERCRSCSAIHLCNLCPGVAQNGGAASIDYYCRVAAARARGVGAPGRGETSRAAQ